MMRRLVTTAALSATLNSSGVVTSSSHAFSSSFSSGTDSYKPQPTFNSRSGAHRHPKKAARYNNPTPTTKEDVRSPITTVENTAMHEEEQEGSMASSVAPPQRNIKSRYTDLFKPKRESITFTSSFNEPNMRVVEPAKAEVYKPSQQMYSHQRQRATRTRDHGDDEATDVTKIYSTEELSRIVKEPRGGEPIRRRVAETSKGASADDDVDVLRALEGDDDEDADISPNTVVQEFTTATDDADVEEEKSASAHNVVRESYDDDMGYNIDLDDDTPAATAQVAEGDEDELTMEDDMPTNAEDAFASIKSHPFFNDMLRNVEKSMMRYRKEIRTTGRYGLAAINDCVRPLLQLTDYPFTADQLAELSSAISPAVLKSSLGNRAVCKELQLYRSRDTELILDWSVEDFLRRRYESVHISWEPMDVVYRRFGWTPDLISDRDCLLFFSAFLEYVELAELATTATGKPNAEVISDPVAQAERRPIPASRLLIRRKAGAETEPSLTESLRLMGAPALHTPAKGRKNHLRRGAESVTEMFADVERAAEEVDGDEETKLQHGMDSVPSLRQATNPSGRTIKEFSLGRRIPETEEQRASRHPSDDADAEESDAAKRDYTSHNGGKDNFDEFPDEFNRAVFDSLSSAYHKAKVEVSLLRRRLLSTHSVDQVADLQAKLAASRRELSQLNERLTHMRQLKRAFEVSAMHERHGEEFKTLSPSQPNYPEAPEFTDDHHQKNGRAAQDGVIDDAEIDMALNEYKQEMEWSLPKQAHEPQEPAHHHHHKQAAFRRTVDAVEYEEEESSYAKPITQHAKSSDRHKADTAAADEVELGEDEVDDIHEEEEPTISNRTNEKKESRYQRYSSKQQMKVLTPREELAKQREEVSWAAEKARAELRDLKKEQMRVMSELNNRVASTEKKLAELEERLASIKDKEATLQAAEEREAVERKASEVEKQLRIQREMRQAALELQREQARAAQLEAERLREQQLKLEQQRQEEHRRQLERQRQLELDALAKEQELERQLREVRAQLRGEGVAMSEPRKAVPEAVAAEVEKHDLQAPAVSTVTTESPSVDSSRIVAPAAASASTPAASSHTPTGSYFMCTPEQYDGLHLAASRLRREITALEKQMEDEGDEDDETLMAVLAASRADLEELDECIDSVQQHAPWTAERDACRERELKRTANVGDTETQQVQAQIDNLRFTISLLQKRLGHTNIRSVMNKLEQGIVQARREISRLRIEQDRLRKSGRDAFGLPSSISMAETLAEEVKETEAKRRAAEVLAAAEEDESDLRSTPTASAAAMEEEDAAHGVEDIAAEAAASGNSVESFGDEEDERQVDAAAAAASSAVDATTTTPAAGAMPAMEDADARQMQLRLDTMLRDIQSLQDNIGFQERASDYDDEETEAVLHEMRQKLGALLQLRDDVQKRLAGGSTNNRPSVSPPPPPPVVPHRRAEAVAPASTQTNRSIPLVSRVSSANKKLRTAARQVRRIK